MREFSYRNKIHFTLPKTYIEHLLDLVEPFNFSILYRDIYDLIKEQKDEEGKVLQQKKEKHPPEIIAGLKNIDTTTDTLIKRQTALSLIYMLLSSKLKSQNDRISISLNMMLAYELYSTLADEQLKFAREVSEIDAGTHPKVKDIIDVNKGSEIKNEYLNKIALNKKLIDVIFKEFTYAEMHKIRLDYIPMSLLNHLDYCNLPN